MEALLQFTKCLTLGTERSLKVPQKVPQTDTQYYLFWASFIAFVEWMEYFPPSHAYILKSLSRSIK